MTVLKPMVLVALAVFVCACTGCKQTSPHYDPRYRLVRTPGPISSSDEWFDGPDKGAVLYGCAEIYGGKVFCDIINWTRRELVLNMSGSFGYAVRYRDREGRERDWVGAMGSLHFGDVKILAGQDVEELRLACDMKVRVSLELPGDCVSVLAVTLEVECLEYSEFRACRNRRELLKTFLEHQTRVPMDFVRAQNPGVHD